jgi:parallel beta-helix repeat protein
MLQKKRSVLFVISILFLSFIGNLFLIENCLAAGTMLYVGGVGPGNYTTIQNAIDSATNGDTIFVMSGTYTENLYIEKSLTLVGESKPVINGKDSLKSTIEIMSNGTTISNFIIQNDVSKNYSGIAIGKTQYQQGDYSSVSIMNCRILNVYRGILIKGFSNTVNLCEFDSNHYYAIDIVSGGNSDVISENVINGNLRGINLQSDCMNIIIRDNTISNNRDDGIHIWIGCSNNQIYHNHFIENYPHQAYDIETNKRNNSWDDGYPSGGNYWSDYTGYDNYSGIDQDIPGGDEIGDIPYSILGGQAVDRYPIGEIQIPQQPGEENQIPNAYILSISPNPAEFGQSVALRGSASDSDGFIITYEWKSNLDGKLSQLSEFQTINLSVGIHTISFRVQDNDGVWSASKTASLTIRSLESQAPSAFIDEITPNPAIQGESVHFQGHGTDEDGVITAYKWISNKSGIIGTTASFTKSNLSIGTHTIYFQVKDEMDWSSPVQMTITIQRNMSGNPNNQAPHAYPGGPYTCSVHQVVSFNGSLSFDEEGTIIGFWNFGDNTTGNGLITTHTYTSPGTYTVTLTVTDEDGMSSTAATSAIITQSGSQSNPLSGFFIADFEIPFPLLIVAVVLLIVGILIGFIYKIKQRY